MAISGLLALPIELAVAATVQLADQLSDYRLLMAAHQRILCQKS
jgi:hypothetical protein